MSELNWDDLSEVDEFDATGERECSHIACCLGSSPVRELLRAAKKKPLLRSLSETMMPSMQPKPQTKAINKWLQNNIVNVVEWPCQSRELGPVEYTRLGTHDAHAAQSQSSSECRLML